MSVYSDQFGGAVFNVAIGMYAYCTIIPTSDETIEIVAYDNNNSLKTKSVPALDVTDNNLLLHKGVYNRIVKDYNNGKPLSFKMYTSNDAPAGSGLGTSSTMVVAILEAFNRWLGLGLNQYQKALLAYQIEREDLGLSGGKQDQYAAVFGGVNLMEFKTDTSTLVNQVRVEKSIINELECAMVLYYCGRSRESSRIIDEQIKNASNEHDALFALHQLKSCAYLIKDYVLLGDYDNFAETLNNVWEQKKTTTSTVSNKELDDTIDFIKQNGATSVLLSGAGGGGIMIIYCKPIHRQKLLDALSTLPGKTFPVKFAKNGVESWIIED